MRHEKDPTYAAGDTGIVLELLSRRFASRGLLIIIRYTLAIIKWKSVTYRLLKTLPLERLTLCPNIYLTIPVNAKYTV